MHGEVVPQIWTYEQQLVPAPTGQPYRAFVWMQGHNYANFANPQVQPMLLRGDRLGGEALGRHADDRAAGAHRDGGSRGETDGTCLIRSASTARPRGSASRTRTASSIAAGSGRGLPEGIFDGRPVIGICNTWSELTPCNGHFRELAEHVKRGVWEAGGLPFEFPVMSLGETSLRPTAMLFRNLASMDVEESIRAQPDRRRRAAVRLRQDHAVARSWARRAATCRRSSSRAGRC